MIVQISKKGKDIIVSKNYNECNNKSEVSKVITELELIKKELLEMYDEFDKDW